MGVIAPRAFRQRRPGREGADETPPTPASQLSLPRAAGCPPGHGWVPAKRAGPAVSAQELHPGTFQRAFEAANSCKEEVDFASFDFLEAAQMKIGKLREPFLRQAARRALATHVCAEVFNVDPIFAR
jgi:hypothetical protein